MNWPAPKLAGGPRIMGIVNATPDSFSDGGRFRDARAAADAAFRMIEEGADVVDVGGESTRPGAAPISANVETARVVPVIEAIRARSDALVSIDTMKPEVARSAFAAGADIWNDVFALRAPAAIETAADLQAPVILMHMQGEARTMQADPVYGDVVAEVIDFLRMRTAAAEAAGLADIWIDPGIGFGKTLEHNLALIRALGRIKAETGKPLLFGASRKSMIAKIEARASDVGDRLGGSLALALAAARADADMIRVHDVRQTVQALRVARAVENTVVV
jgi:dihydropteroate synthase